MKFSLQGFDENGNDILDDQEIVRLQKEFYLTSDSLDAWTKKRAWTDSQMDGDYNTGTKVELVQYYLRILNATRWTSSKSMSNESMLNVLSWKRFVSAFLNGNRLISNETNEIFCHIKTSNKKIVQLNSLLNFFFRFKVTILPDWV